MDHTGSMTGSRDSRISLTLEIDPASDPITGSVRVAAEVEGQEFVGWLGLAKALERLLETGRTATPHGPTG